MTDHHNAFSELLDHPKLMVINLTVSLAVITMDWWLPSLKKASELAATISPILLVLWLATQIGWKWYRELKK